MDRNADCRMRALSLFSGIGGLDIALQEWCKVVCYCEIDPFPLGVLIKNMVQGSLDIAPIWDDIKTFGKPEVDKIRPVDCIYAGFPCQDISGLGKRAGIKKGTRSGLFFELMRIVCLVKPQILFLENVHRLLAAGMGLVLRELSKSGYNAVWKVLSAKELGFPHQRNRVWILAYPCGRRFNRNVVLRAIACKRKRKASFRSEDPNKFKLCLGKVAPTKWQSQRCDNSQPLFIRSDNGIPSQLDKLRIKGLGNAVVPQCAALAFRILLHECLASRRRGPQKVIVKRYLLPKRW